jgi:Cu/Ag efflux pump CusA
MCRAIIAFSLRHRGLVLGVAALVLTYGAFVLRRLPVDVFPDLNRPTVTLLTESPGIAPEEVEPRVTFPIETAMRGLAGVRRVRSQTAFGLSVVHVEFDWSMEIYRARQLISERLGGLAEVLPPGVVPVMGPISSIMGEILLVGVVGADGVSPLELRDAADWSVRPRLLTVAGVSQVIVIGGARRELHVRARPLDLQRLGVSISTLEESVERANRAVGGGVLRVGASEVVVRGLARIVEPAQLSASILGDEDARGLRIGDVADVEWAGPLAPRGTAGVDARDAVVLSIQKQPGADSIVVSAEVDRALDGLRASLPKGITLNAGLFRQERFIRESVNNVEEALRDGAILVAIILFLFLLNFRTTFITLTAIPLSFVTSILVFHAFGLSIDTMTLGGLSVALGEVVDDAIVDIENVFRRLKQNRASATPRPALRVVLDASNEVRSSIVLATLTVIIVFLPLFFLESLEGRLFRPLGVAYVVSILASLLVSLTVTPVLSSLLLPRTRRVPRPRIEGGRSAHPRLRTPFPLADRRGRGPRARRRRRPLLANRI